jgi:hypothetical protein
MQTLFANVAAGQGETPAESPTSATFGCGHPQRCPDATAADFRAARAVVAQPGQGWSLLCNGVVLFDDGGALLPDGTAVAPGAFRPAVTDAQFGFSRELVRS